jgi:hypothetical protein
LCTFWNSHSFLPIGFVSLTTIHISGSVIGDPQSHYINAQSVLYVHEVASSSSYTDIRFADEGTQRKLEFLTVTAGSAVFAVPFNIIFLLAATWRHLSRELKYRFVLLVIASTCVSILGLALFVPSLITSPFYLYVENGIYGVGFKWPIILLLVINLIVGLGSSIYFILVGIESGNTSASN